MNCSGDCVRMPQDTLNRMDPAMVAGMEIAMCSATAVIVKAGSVQKAKKLMTFTKLYGAPLREIRIM